MVGESKLAVVNPQLAVANAARRVRTWPNAPWVEHELQKLAASLKEADTIAEVGVGAGSYARSLNLAAAARVTLDLPMRTPMRAFQWPISDESIDLLISVDALHYETDVPCFVREAARVLRTTKLLAFVARSRPDLQSDGLARYFPQAVERALPLIAEIPVLEKMLEHEGLYCVARTTLAGQLLIDEALLRAIAHRELTGLATLTDEEFTRGVDEMKTALGRGDTAWPSTFTLLVCRKVRPWKLGASASAQMGMA